MWVQLPEELMEELRSPEWFDTGLVSERVLAYMMRGRMFVTLPGFRYMRVYPFGRFHKIGHQHFKGLVEKGVLKRDKLNRRIYYSCMSCTGTEEYKGLMRRYEAKKDGQAEAAAFWKEHGLPGRLVTESAQTDLAVEMTPEEAMQFLAVIRDGVGRRRR